MSRHASRRERGTIVPRSSSTAPSPRHHRAFARLVGAMGMITLTALLFWLLTDDGFRVTEADVTFEGLQHADETEVRAYLADLDRAPNVFRVRASDIVSRLSELTEVDAAHAVVTLPASVSVELDEREPLFIWSNGQVSWLVDEAGMLFAPADEPADELADAAADDDVGDPQDRDPDPDLPPDPDPDLPPAADPDPDPQDRDPDPGLQDRDPAVGDPQNPDPDPDLPPAADPGSAARSALPMVRDDRRPEVKPAVGSFLSATDMAVMRQLLALTPELLDSRSQDLRLRVDDLDGYVLESRDRGWDALFGRYTPSVQPPGVISRQVQCLRWLLGTEESRLERVWLALGETTCGTYTTIGTKRDRQG